MKIYFGVTNGYNMVIFTDGLKAKLFMVVSLA